MSTTESDAVEAPVEETEAKVPVAGEDYPVGEAPIILPGYWVRLAATKHVPEEVWGHLASVEDAPVSRHEGDPHGLSPRAFETQDEKAKFNVRTRDQFNMVIQGLTRRDFSEVAHDRVTLENHG